MGFGKKDGVPHKSKKGANAEARTDATDKFRPTTDKELKTLVKRAKLREQAKKEPKLPVNDPIKGLKDIDVKKPRAFLRTYKEIIQEQIANFKLDKKKNPYAAAPEIPRYEMFEPTKLAESNFVNHVIGSLIFFSWKELKRLCKAGMNLPDYGKDFMSTLSLARRAMYHVIGVEVDEKGVRYRLADRDATLELWPAKPLEDRNVSKSSVKESNKKAKKKSKAVEEDEEVDELEEVDEAPINKKAKKGRDGNKKVVDKAPAKKSSPVQRRNPDAVYKTKKLFESGVRHDFQSCIPSKGAKFEVIAASAKKKFDIPEGKSKSYLSWLVKNKFISVM